MRLFFLLLFTFLGLSITESSADLKEYRAGQDYALFFAVNKYAKMSSLNNPIKNARDLARVLGDDYGFQTEVVEDPTFVTIEKKLNEYRQKFSVNELDQKGQLLIFFSGHGLHRGSNGYFVPTDGDPDIIHRTGVEYDWLRDEINAFACQHILVTIDACHSATFDPKWNSKTDRNFGRVGDRSSDKILLAHQAHEARLFITSDANGEETPDKSSLAREFLRALKEHTSNLGYLSHNELLGSYLKGRAIPTPGGGEFGRNEIGSRFLFFQQRVAVPDNTVNDLADWRDATKADDCPAYRSYLEKHPRGDFAREAKKRIAPCEAEERMLAAWVNTKTRNDCKSYKRFASDYPGSLYAKLVPGKLKQLNCSGTAEPVTKPDRVVGTNRNTAFLEENMIKVSGGGFTLGCSIGTINCERDEFPQKNVSMSTFYIQRNEVTNAQFLTFLKSYNSDNVKSGEYTGQKMIYPSSSGLTKRNGKWAIRKGYENHPVVDVTWYGAITFAEYYGLRLPTEAEWEFVAKGGVANNKFVFSGSDNLYNTGIYAGNSNFDSAVVGSKGSTHNLGVNDLSGNAWEWCNDWYTPNYNAVGTSNPKGPNSGTTKIIRGGSYSEKEWEARVTNREHKLPATHANNIGFRCAK